MLGCVIGDIAGSVYEGCSGNTPGLPLLAWNADFTDDTVAVCAVADALLSGADMATTLRTWVKRYPARGYGAMFLRWCQRPAAGPYQSHGNGGALRVAPIALASRTESEAVRLAREVAGLTHDDESALRCAEALCRCCWAALYGASRMEIRSLAGRLDCLDERSLQAVRDSEEFSERADRTVPIAIACAVGANDFESAIRNAIFVGGDTDSIAAMAGGLAECLFGVPYQLAEQFTGRCVPQEMAAVLQRLYETHGRPFPLPAKALATEQAAMNPSPWRWMLNLWHGYTKRVEK